MNSFIKKIFSTLSQKPWEAEQAIIDTEHTGQTFNLSNQMSAVIIIFGISSVLFRQASSECILLFRAFKSADKWFRCESSDTAKIIKASTT